MNLFKFLMNLNIKKKHQTLVDEINQADRDYWVLNTPKLSDADYDQKLAELLKMEAEFPDLVHIESPTQRRAGGLSPGFEAVPHFEGHPMLSFDKIFDQSKLTTRIKDWASASGHDEVEAIVEPKIDGLSLDLCYLYGTLTQALTGGTGTHGDDVTANARTIRTIPLHCAELKEIPEIHIRGEVCMLLADFTALNTEQAAASLPQFSHPRNAAVGAIRSLDSKECGRRRLTFFPYNVISFDHTKLPIATQDRLHNWFKKIGFKPLPWYSVGTSLDETVDLVLKFEAVRARLPMPTDGSVVKLNNRLSWKNFPNSNTAVRWGYAYKYAPEQAETILKGITVQVGRTGRLAPVAELEPVELAGSTIARATLCNERRIRVRDFRLRDTIVIQKDGDVIPGAHHVVLNQRPEGTVPFVMPDQCPVCGHAVEKTTTEEDGEDPGPLTHYTCINETCPAILEGKLLHWSAKDNMDIRGLGDVAAKRLVRSLHVTSVDRLYTLTEAELHTGATEGVFGLVEAENLVAAIQASKDRGMESVIAGLGIDRIGNTVARKLSRIYPDVHAFLQDSGNWHNYLGKADIASLEQVRVSTGVLIKKLESNGVNMKSKTYSESKATGGLSGAILVFTGEISLERTQATRMAEAAGAKVTSSVSKKTTHLVVGESPGSKLEKAQAIGTIKILTEDQFRELVTP